MSVTTGPSQTLAASGVALAGRLDGIDLTLRPGEVTAICGPNGAGKSSLLAVLAGLERPDNGAVALAGDDLARMRPADRARRIGYLPQSPEMAWNVSVETLVALGRLPWPDQGALRDSPAIDRAMEAMDLISLRTRPVAQLSGGERARVLLARVLAGEPDWLLADEPLAMLDLAHATGLLDRLHRLAVAGCGVALVLHDLAAAMNRADRVVVLYRGAVVADGLPQEALAADVIDRVWGVTGHWLGEAGAMAFAITPS